jgi:hypothetical protein
MRFRGSFVSCGVGLTCAAVGGDFVALIGKQAGSWRNNAFCYGDLVTHNTGLISHSRDLRLSWSV